MNYTIVEDFNESLLEELQTLFKNEWWTKKRQLPDIREMISNSGVVIGIVNNEASELLGFGRAITDSQYRAFIFDVIIKEQYRSVGLGKLLLDSILSHPRIVNVERVELYCPERLVPYYEKFAFSTEVNGSKLMRLKR